MARESHRVFPDSFARTISHDGRQVAYIRVSNLDQNPECQLKIMVWLNAALLLTKPPPNTGFVVYAVRLVFVCLYQGH